LQPFLGHECAPQRCPHGLAHKKPEQSVTKAGAKAALNMCSYMRLPLSFVSVTKKCARTSGKARWRSSQPNTLQLQRCRSICWCWSMRTLVPPGSQAMSLMRRPRQTSCKVTCNALWVARAVEMLRRQYVSKVCNLVAHVLAHAKLHGFSADKYLNYF